MLSLYKINAYWGADICVFCLIIRRDLCEIYVEGSRGSSVSTVSGCGLDDRAIEV
jgi:hypothetical protein